MRSTRFIWPTTWPTGLKFTSLAASGYRWPRCTASSATIICSGIGSGPGDSSPSQASVQSLRSIRHGLPVNDRDRTVSWLVAST